MKFKNYNDEFEQIKNNAENKLNEIKAKYNKLGSPSEELSEKVETLETLVKDLTINSTLEYHLELKLLVQEIEKLLEEENLDPRIPSVDSLLLSKDTTNNKLLNICLVNLKDPDSTIINVVYKLFKTPSEFIEDIDVEDSIETQTFSDQTSGVYYSEGTIFYKLKEDGVVKELNLISNTVVIEEESKIPPTIRSLELIEDDKVLSARVIGILDLDHTITKVTYKLIKNNHEIVDEVTEDSNPTFQIVFGTKTIGNYHSEVFVDYDLNDGVDYNPIVRTSNTITIDDVIPDDFPENLPHSNTWAYAEENNGSVTVTLNNTWGTIGNSYGIYKDNKLIDTGSTALTALNKGSAKNSINLSNHNLNSSDDYKIVYKITYKRYDKEDVVIYYKSTTGIMEVSQKGSGQKMCSLPRWDPSMKSSSASNPAPDCWHNGKHWTQVYWISQGDVPGNGYNGWGELVHSACPNPSDINVHSIYDPTNSTEYLEPMNPNEVVGLNEPMEKKHITYLPEWGKWGARAYTPKIAPWDKISHAQYAFIDVRPDYNNGFILDKDFSIAEVLSRSVTDCKTWDSSKTTKISPNIFDPGAAFSTYGMPNTNPFLTEFTEYSKKFPYVVPAMSLGGWSRSGFFRDAASENSRAFFVERCIDLMRIMQVRAIDIDWEYPEFPRDGDIKDNINDLGTPRGDSNESRLFTLLMKDLRAALDAAGEEDGKYYFLSCAVSTGKLKIDTSDLDDWHQYADYISYMSYDVHGAFDEYTNHHSYTHQNPDEPSSLTNPDNNAMAISDVINYITTKGIPKEKLLVGAPFYSRGWSGIFKKQNESWVIPTCPGLYTKTNIQIQGDSDLKGRAAPGIMDGGRAAGVMPIRHLNALINGESVNINVPGVMNNINPFTGTAVNGRNFKRYFDESSMAPYLFSESDGIFYTYEDIESISYKSNWILEENIGGLISWDISLDDYGHALVGLNESYDYNSYNLEEHQLTEAIYSIFKSNKAKVNKKNKIR